MSQPPDPHPGRNRRALIAAALILGAAAVAAGFIAFRPRNPLRDVPLGAPPQRVRLVSYNILHGQRGLPQVADEIRKLAPDVVLLQEVEKRDARELARALGMEATFDGDLYHPSENLAVGGASWGNLILSRHPLGEAESIPNPGGGSFGVWAWVAIGGRRFLVANVHLSATWKVSLRHLQESGANRWKELSNMVQAWRDRGSPPIVIGGDFNLIPAGSNYELMTATWTDALAKLGKTGSTFAEGWLRTRIDYFLVSKEFDPADGGVVTSDASDHRPVWLDIVEAKP